MTVGGRIRQAREAQGVGTASLAEALGVHRRTVERWESGEVEPSRAKLRVVALLLNCTVAWLAAGTCVCGANDWIMTDPYGDPYPEGKALCGVCARTEGAPS